MLSPSGIYLRKNAQRKYEAIVKSACRLFLKHGYTRTSMDAVAIDAQVSKQTVYSYFSNKDVLFCQMIALECERHSPPEGVLESGSMKQSEALYRIGRGMIDLISTPRGLAIHRLVMAEAERHPRIARLFYDSGPRRLQKMLEKYLKLQAQQGLLAIKDVEQAACHFLGLVKGPFYLRLMLRIKPLPTRKEMDDHIHDSVKLFLKFYAK